MRCWDAAQDVECSFIADAGDFSMIDFRFVFAAPSSATASSSVMIIAGFLDFTLPSHHDDTRRCRWSYIEASFLPSGSAYFRSYSRRHRYSADFSMMPLRLSGRQRRDDISLAECVLTVFWPPLYYFRCKKRLIIDELRQYRGLYRLVTASDASQFMRASRQ